MSTPSPNTVGTEWPRSPPNACWPGARLRTSRSSSSTPPRMAPGSTSGSGSRTSSGKWSSAATDGEGVWFPPGGTTLGAMPSRDHNPHGRRLYLPIARAGGNGHGAAPLEDTHVAHSVGCAQTTRPARRPEWLKVKAQFGPNYGELKRIMRGLDLHTVCEEAGCPNIYECWEDREATFLILGDTCTRRCGFCDVMTAKPEPVDANEPQRVAQAVQAMGLQYV